MSRKYDEIMDKIEVSEKMRHRILENIRKTGIDEKKKACSFPAWKQYISFAACFAIILAGAIIVPNLLNQPPALSDPPINGTLAMEECASVEELSTAVGFSVEGLPELPFESNHEVYTSYWGELAQIAYCGSDGQTALYRKSIGTDDNSGNYDSFGDVIQTTIGGMTVTLKGAGETYSLAWWTDGTYAYSVCLSERVSQAAWEAMILSIE